LVDIAEAIYQLIRKGEANLSKALNFARKHSCAFYDPVRVQDLVARRDDAEVQLIGRIDTRNLSEAMLPTAFLVTAEDIDRLVERHT
jgi:hypothetical protein